MLPLSLLLALASVAAAGATAPSAAPAEWRTYDILVDFQDLPRTYSCDDLWYRFRDVLLALGARAYMTITPYHCGYVGGGEERSPSVEVRFQLPQPVTGAARQYAQVSVLAEKVRLAPGSPRSLTAADCELVRQLKDGLLAALPVRVDTATFSCSAPRRSFALTLEASVPVPAPGRQAGIARPPRA